MNKIQTVADAEQLMQDLSMYCDFRFRFVQEMLKDVPANVKISDHVSEAEEEDIMQSVCREVGISAALVKEIDNLDREQQYALIHQVAAHLGLTAAGTDKLLSVLQKLLG
jgi:hypothetical protein